MSRSGRGSIAVVGSGVAGITAAYLLQRRYDVTLIEADARVGGHADTHDVSTPDGRWLRIDTGFIVHNKDTYPNLLRLFGELDVPTKPIEMSLSITCPTCKLQYAGGRGFKGIAAQPRRLADPRFVRMLVEVKRFHRDAHRLLASDSADVDSISLAGFVALHRYSDYFVNHFLVPTVAAVWSTGASLALQYPARYLFQFLDHHRMLQVTGSPVWRSVDGGSRTYVERAVKQLSAVETSAPVKSIHRHSDGVEIRDDSDRIFKADHVVIATHPEQALRMLADPTVQEKEILGALPYSRNTAVLHTDDSVLPTATEARSSWNYEVPQCTGRASESVGVSYWMNRLHDIDEPLNYLVSLNNDDRIDPAKIIAHRKYEHPVYTAESLAAQRKLPSLNGDRTAYAGAYHGWGFHEDGCRSGVAAAGTFGASW